MTALLDTNTASDAMRATARRIELSQEDEIEMMQDWLRERGQAVTAVDAHHAPGFQPMPGMLTAEEMASLAEAAGNAFDRLFLELMIKHHRGAVTMVENLLRQRGAAQDSVLFAFTSDITADQTAEINRMDAMLAELSPDPRVPARGRLRRRRPGAVEHGPRRHAAETRGLLRSAESGGPAHAGPAGPGPGARGGRA